WKDKLIESYERQYGNRLNIPRWNDIADKYISSQY
ncbi:MAG: NgoBV family restriction endonuclease, partial [Prevotella bivia]|nr:NgoBV family restriction endonuclease [Prevotella bivia]